MERTLGKLQEPNKNIHIYISDLRYNTNHSARRNLGTLMSANFLTKNYTHTHRQTHLHTGYLNMRWWSGLLGHGEGDSGGDSEVLWVGGGLGPARWWRRRCLVGNSD